jgi:hypothetical protein
MQPITFAMAPMSLAEFKTLNWAHLRKVRKRIFAYPFLFIAVLAINFYTQITEKPLQTNSFTWFLILTCICLFCGLLVFNINKNIKKNYLNTPILAEGMTVTLTENSISVHGPSVNGEQSWPNSYKQAIAVKNWIVLSYSAASVYFLDTNRIVPPATTTDVEELFQHKGIKFVK